jgi:hypothetical protein
VFATAYSPSRSSSAVPFRNGATIVRRFVIAPFTAVTFTGPFVAKRIIWLPSPFDALSHGSFGSSVSS